MEFLRTIILNSIFTIFRCDVQKWFEQVLAGYIIIIKKTDSSLYDRKISKI